MSEFITATHHELIEAVAKAEAEYRASDYWNAAVPFEQQVVQGRERMRLDYAVRAAKQRLYAYEQRQLAELAKDQQS